MSKFTVPTLLASTIQMLLWAPVHAADNPGVEKQDEQQAMEVIVVSGDFRGLTLEKMPSSVTVIDEQRIEDQGAEHFEDMLGNVANFNWSGASSRPRYFQIRGVGEQEQYQGAPNSSVGFIIDDIDLSGLGSVSSLYDLQQFEVLRGPQVPAMAPMPWPVLSISRAMIPQTCSSTAPKSRSVMIICKPSAASAPAQ